MSEHADGASVTRGPHPSEKVDDEGGWSLEFDSGATPVMPNMAGHDSTRLGPKKVVLSAFVADLVDVDTATQTFRPKLQVTLDWVDDGVISKQDEFEEGTAATASSWWSGDYSYKEPFGEEPGSSSFNPNIALVNGVDDDSPNEDSKCQDIYLLRGRPIISQYFEFFPTLRTSFDLRDFPFDESELSVEFTSSFWSSNDIEFVWSDIMRQGLKCVDPVAIGGRGESEFEIIRVSTISTCRQYVYLSRYDNQTANYPHVVLLIRVRRDPFSFLTRVASVTVLLMTLEGLSFLVDASDLGGRFSVSGTCFLSLCAFASVTMDSLPKAAVVTRCDKWNLANFGLIFLSNVENVLAFTALQMNLVEQEVLFQIEVFCALVYLAAVILVFAWFCKPILVKSKSSKHAPENPLVSKKHD